MLKVFHLLIIHYSPVPSCGIFRKMGEYTDPSSKQGNFQAENNWTLGEISHMFSLVLISSTYLVWITTEKGILPQTDL